MTHKKSLRFTLHTARALAYTLYIRSNQSQIDIHTSYDAHRLLPCHWQQILIRFCFSFVAHARWNILIISWNRQHIILDTHSSLDHSAFDSTRWWRVVHMHSTSFCIIGQFFLAILQRLLLISSLSLSLLRTRSLYRRCSLYGIIERCCRFAICVVGNLFFFIFVSLV